MHADLPSQSDRNLGCSLTIPTRASARRLAESKHLQMRVVKTSIGTYPRPGANAATAH